MNFAVLYNKDVAFANYWRYVCRLSEQSKERAMTNRRGESSSLRAAALGQSALCARVRFLRFEACEPFHFALRTLPGQANNLFLTSV